MIENKYYSYIEEIEKYEKKGILNGKLKEWEEEFLKVDEENEKIKKEIDLLKDIEREYDKGKLEKSSKIVIEPFLLIRKLYDQWREIYYKWDYLYKRIKWAKMTPEQRKKRKEEIDKAERERKKIKKFEANLSKRDLRLRRVVLKAIEFFRVGGCLQDEKSLKNMEELLYKAANKKKYFFQAKKLVDEHRRAIEKIYRKSISMNEKIELKEELIDKHKRTNAKMIYKLIKKSGALKNIKRVLTKKEYNDKDSLGSEFKISLEQYINGLTIQRTILA